MKTRSESAKPFLKPLNTILISKPTQSKKSNCDAVKPCQAGQPGKYKRLKIPCSVGRTRGERPKPEWGRWQLRVQGDSGTHQLPGWEQPLGICTDSSGPSSRHVRKKGAAPCHPHSSFMGNVWGETWITAHSRPQGSTARVPQWARSQQLLLQKTAHTQIFKIPTQFFW